MSWVVGFLLQALYEITEPLRILDNIVNYYLSPFAIYLSWLVDAFCIVRIDQPMSLEIRKQNKWVCVLYQLGHQFVEHFPFGQSCVCVCM